MSVVRKTRVLHLLDAAGHGDVARGLAGQLPRLADRFPPRVHTVTSWWRPLGPLHAEVIVVHFALAWSKLPFLLALRARAGRVPLVFVEHFHAAPPRRRGLGALLRLCYRLADRVVAVSQVQADGLHRSGLVPAGRLVTIPPAADLSAVASLPPVPPLPRPLRLGAYGRYVPQEEFGLLIAAMRRVPPGVATLELAGHGPGLPALREAAADLPQVRIGGPCNDLAAFLAGVDAVVVPSRREAGDLTVAEARAAGRPVIVARSGGLAQAEPSWGLLFAPGDPEQLAAAIIALAAGDLPAMGEAGRRSLAFALERSVAGWDALLRDVTGGAAATAATGFSLPAFRSVPPHSGDADPPDERPAAVRRLASPRWRDRSRCLQQGRQMPA